MASTTRRQFLRMLAIGSGGTLLAACTTAPPAAPTTTTAPPAAPTTAPAPTQPPPVAKPASTQAAPATGPTAATQVKDVSFVVVDGTEPINLDPAAATGPWQHINNAIYNGLVEWNLKGEVVPSLATTWDASPDGKVWTFKLRPNVKFHDGTAFTSAAVKATIDHILDKETASGRRANYTLIKDIATPDDLTVKFTIDPPTPDFPLLMADGSVKILSPAALKKYGKDFGRNPVGTGPFMFEEWKPNDHVSAVINPDYWGPKPLVRRFVYRPIPEAAARVVVLKTGEADVVFNLSPEDIANLSKDSNVAIQTTPSQTIAEVEPAQSKPPLNDVRVRQALNMAIDKDSIIKNIMRGLALPLNTPAIPGSWGAFDFEPFKFDPAKAKQMLADAGYPNGMDLTIYHTSGRWAGDDQVVEAVQGYWANIGVRAKIQKMDNAQRSTVTRGDPDKRAGTLALLQKTSEYTDYHLFRMFHSSATNIPDTAQRTAYANPQVDKLIEAERNSLDPQKRLEYFKQAEELIWKDQPLIFLFQAMNAWGQRKNLSGFTVLPSNELVPGQLQK